MTTIGDLLGRVRSVATEVRNSIRTEANDKNLAGWGQFVEPSSQVFQIGPYGTSAGVLLTQIENFNAPVDVRVKAQLRQFWDEKPAGKLFPQNVRLAFVVLALARSSDAELTALREEMSAELKKRQSSDGSWSDATPHAGAPTGGQNDATAWVTLALFRVDAKDQAAQRGAEWLANRAEGAGDVPLLSPIAVAAAIVAHPKSNSLTYLRRRAFDLLKARRLAGELISFFDYEEIVDKDTSVQKRDYLCFPAFYIEAALIHGLSTGATFLDRQRLSIYKEELLQKMVSLTSGTPYKVAGTRFTSTVDQAFYALSYEHLSEAESENALTKSYVAPILSYINNSIIFRLVIPIFLILISLLTIQDVDEVPRTLGLILGPAADPLIEFSKSHAALLKLVAGLIVVLLTNLPSRGWDILKSKFWG